MQEFQLFNNGVLWRQMHHKSIISIEAILNDETEDVHVPVAITNQTETNVMMYRHSTKTYRYHTILHIRM